MNTVAELPMDAATLQRYKKAMMSADSVEEAGAYLRNFGVTQEHIDFLAGIGGLAKLREAYNQCIEFDLKNGTRTFEFIHETTMQQNALDRPELFAKPEHAAHGVKHRPSLTKVIDAAIRKAVDILQDDYGIDASDASFFDLGTGTGKPALIAATRHNFAAVTGVDYFREVIDLADANKKSMGLDQRHNVRFIFADATEFRRFNGTNVVFMYNPFDEEIMKLVEQNLRKHGGKTLVIYNKPAHHHLFKPKNWEPLWKEDHPDDDHKLMIFARGFDKRTIKNPGQTPIVMPELIASPELEPSR